MKKTLYLVIIISATFTHLLHAQNQTDFFKLTSQTPKNNQAFKEDDIQVIGIKYPTSETSNVKIYLDDKDVTSQAVVRNESVHFIQKSKLFEGKHTIIVMVNQHTTSWQFTTSSPPKITNLLPNRGILAKSTKLIIGAQFLDRVYGVNLSSIILKLNGKDITSFANISHDKISYSPPFPSKAGKYEVTLEISDNSNYKTSKKWGFMIKKGDPEITFTSAKQLSHNSAESYFSAEFIDKNSDLVKVLTTLDIDFQDVTKEAVISYSDNRKGTIIYKFTKSLKPGRHSALLSVANKSGGTANENFEFYVE